MKFRTIVAASSMLFLSASAWAITKLETHHYHGHGHTCDGVYCTLRSSGIVENTFVPPSKPINLPTRFLRNDEGSAEEGLSADDLTQFEINFAEGVPEEARTAAIYALLLWENHLTSPVPIAIHLTWEDLGGEEGEGGALAQAGPSYFPVRAANSQHPNHFEPAVIKDRKEQVDDRPLRPELTVTVNSNPNIAFYYGLDGATPSNQHDLVSILLHEFAHGLGVVDMVFTDGSEDTEATQAEIGFADGTWTLFDGFLQTFEGDSLTDPLFVTNPSADLLDRVQDRVFFAGPLATIANQGFRPRLYAPDTFDPGSSIAHLNETTFPAGDPNSLMTPRIGFGEAIHDPGEVLKGMLGDIGWNHVWINLTPVKDVEDVASEIPVTLIVESDSILETAPTIAYRKTGLEGEFTSGPMVFNELAQNWSFTIPAPLANADFEYFVEVAATGERIFRYPEQNNESTLKFSVGPDTTIPRIQHTPPDYVFSNLDTISLPFLASDNLGIGTTTIEFNLDEGVAQSIQGLSLGNDAYRFQATLDLSNVSNLNYRIFATDAATAANGTVLPANGFFSVPIERIFAPVIAYQNSFDQPGDAGHWLLDDFTISTPAGFTSPHLGTPHPYRNDGVGTIHTHAYLRQQIQVTTGMEIKFDQIVLVETPEEGNSFGDPEFWDYVIVEASKDSGLSWFPLTDGFDSSIDPNWNTLYNENLDANNRSLASGNASLFMPYTISLDAVPQLYPGDVIMIRFRLFSDPLAVGWGWAIDNLRIGVGL